MLRPTAARAFGPPPGDKPPVAAAQSGARRDEATRQLFRDLHERLGTQCREPAALSLFEVSAAHAGARGLEFHLRGPGAELSFVDTLEGTIAVRAGGPDGVPVELLSVYREGEAFRPIRKPLVVGRRTGFAFTSSAELARRYVAWAREGRP